MIKSLLNQHVVSGPEFHRSEMLVLGDVGTRSPFLPAKPTNRHALYTLPYLTLVELPPHTTYLGSILTGHFVPFMSQI